LDRELKLHLVKKLVNCCTRILDKILPETEPYFPQGKMAQNVFTALDQVFRIEAYCGRFDDQPRQSLKMLKDRNFEHFLSLSRKILLYLSENDRYYRMWLGLALILAHDEYEKALRALTREEFVGFHLEQWELKLSCIGEQHFQRHRSMFLDMMLAAHLPNLVRKSLPGSNPGGSATIKKK
jgi:hypothetical protein